MVWTTVPSSHTRTDLSQGTESWDYYSSWWLAGRGSELRSPSSHTRNDLTQGTESWDYYSSWWQAVRWSNNTHRPDTRDRGMRLLQYRSWWLAGRGSELWSPPPTHAPTWQKGQSHEIITAADGGQVDGLNYSPPPPTHAPTWHKGQSHAIYTNGV